MKSSGSENDVYNLISGLNAYYALYIDADFIETILGILRIYPNANASYMLKKIRIVELHALSIHSRMGDNVLSTIYIYISTV